MGDGACLAQDVDCYNVDAVVLGAGAIVSQRSHLCTASHDFDDDFALVTGPIRLERGVWICAEAFVGPGVAVGEYAVVLARAVVVRAVAKRAVVAGNPARFVRERRGNVGGTT